MTKQWDDSFTLYRSSPRIVELVLDPDAVDTIIDFFDLENELSRGMKLVMPNGQIKIIVPVSDEKATMYLEYLLEIFSHYDRLNSS